MSGKILNGPEMSRDTNESEYDTVRYNLLSIFDKSEYYSCNIEQYNFGSVRFEIWEWVRDSKNEF